MKQVKIKLQIGNDNSIREISIEDDSNENRILAYAKKKYSSIVNMGGKISLV